MHYNRHIVRPPAQGGIAYVDPTKRLQQWLQGRGRTDRRGSRQADIEGTEN